MYALKTITHPIAGNSAEIVQVLGERYRLEFFGKDCIEGIAARISYYDGGNNPSIDISPDDEAYITTLDGKTVRRICRGAMSNVRKNSRPELCNTAQ